VCAELKLPEHFVLYVGRLQPRKNIARLIEAFAQVCQRHPGLPHQLLITGGKGWLTKGSCRPPTSPRVVDRVRFLGYVPDDALPPSSPPPMCSRSSPSGKASASP
jgi:glycosyltransferase involved in cell wall biosynthesis